MKKITFILITSISLIGCMSSNPNSNVKTKKIDSLSFYRHQVDSMKLEISDLQERLYFALEGLQMREAEVSYWGQKCDSCMMVLNKIKKTK